MTSEVTDFYKNVVDSGVSLRPQDRGPAAKKASRRREPRRHTVSNGIDYNMVWTTFVLLMHFFKSIY